MKYAWVGVPMLWPTATMAEVPVPCADAPNQTEGTLCTKHKLDAAEAGLAKARDALQAKLDANGRHNLDLAQESWRRFRDLECRLETGYDAEHPDSKGTIMPTLIGECATALSERRARGLTDQLACPWASAVLVIPCTGAHAASFDCAKASAGMEHLVCGGAAHLCPSVILPLDTSPALTGRVALELHHPNKGSRN